MQVSGVPLFFRPRRRRERFERWRRRQAQKEWRRYVSQFTSADAWKDDPRNRGRYSTIHHQGADRARQQGYGEAMKQKKASLRKRWHLPKHADIRA